MRKDSDVTGDGGTGRDGELKVEAPSWERRSEWLDFGSGGRKVWREMLSCG